MKKVFVASVCLFICIGICSASGTTAAGFLKLGAGARAAGMGDAFSGIADDATSIYWNPAGMNKVETMSGTFMHAVWFESLAYDFISYVHPVKDTGVFGGSIQYLAYGSLTRTDATGLELGTFSPNDMAITFSYARVISNIPFGVSIKSITSKIVNSASAIALDLGGMYKINEKINTGLVIQNVGTGMKFESDTEPLPMNIKLAGSYMIQGNWLAGLDINIPTGSDLFFALGTEYNHTVNQDVVISGRAGYNTMAKDVTGSMKGICLGIGCMYTKYNFDYAFVPYGDLGTTHKISVSAKF